MRHKIACTMYTFQSDPKPLRSRQGLRDHLARLEGVGPFGWQGQVDIIVWLFPKSSHTGTPKSFICGEKMKADSFHKDAPNSWKQPAQPENTQMFL